MTCVVHAQELFLMYNKKYLEVIKMKLLICALFIKNNFLVFILSLSLLLSTLLLLKTKMELNKFLNVDDIKGYYKTLPEVNLQEQRVVSDNQFFVFDNNKFFRYVDTEVIDLGSYKRIYKNVYVLKGENIDDCIFYINNSFYFYDKKDDYIIKFTKTSTLPSVL